MALKPNLWLMRNDNIKIHSDTTWLTHSGWSWDVFGYSDLLVYLLIYFKFGSGHDISKQALVVVIVSFFEVWVDISISISVPINLVNFSSYWEKTNKEKITGVIQNQYS